MLMGKSYRNCPCDFGYFVSSPGGLDKHLNSEIESRRR